MQIVIDIPDNMDLRNYDIPYDILNIITGGTPLPKGHGRLIDVDVFEKRLMDVRAYYIGEKADDFDLIFAAGLKSAAERLIDAPTIIEADKLPNNELENPFNDSRFGG